MVCASPRSICAPAEPAAPKASRQNCSRAEAVLALFLMRSRAKVLVSSSLSFSSSTSSPFTIAPVGLIRSWQTREHSSAARSRASRATAVDMRTSPVGGPRLSGTVSAGARLGSWRRCAGVIHRSRSTCQELKLNTDLTCMTRPVKTDLLSKDPEGAARLDSGRRYRQLWTAGSSTSSRPSSRPRPRPFSRHAPARSMPEPRPTFRRLPLPTMPPRR